MRNLCLYLLICAVLGLTTAYWMEPGKLDNSYADDDGALVQDKRSDWMTEETRLKRLREMYTLGQQRAKRRSSRRSGEDRDLCIPWRKPCTIDENLKRKYVFLRCCDNMVCKCSFWGSNCRCNARLG